MSRQMRRRVAEEEKGPPIPASERLEMEEVESGARAMLKARALVDQVKGEDVRIKLWKRDVRTGKRQYVTTIDSSIFDEDLVQREYGGGDYFFAALGPKTADSPTGYLGAASFSVSAPEKSEKVVAAGAVGDGFGLRDVLMVLMQQNNALIAALAGRNNGGGAGASELVDVAVKLAELTRGPQTDPVAMILKGMEIAEQRGGDTGRDFESSLLEGVARPLAQIVEHQMTAQRNPPSIVKQEVGTLPRRPVWSPPAGAPDWLAALAPSLPLLAGMAKQGVSPSVVVDMIFDRADDVTLDRIAGDCIAPQWIEETLALLPPVLSSGMHRLWTEQVLTELRDALMKDDGVAEDGPGDDASGHGDRGADTA